MVDGLLLEHRQTGGDSTAPLALPPPGEASGSGEPEARLREAGAEEATEEGASDRGSGLLARGRGEADGEGELLHLRACYICKVWYRRLHHLYGSLCPGCAALNEAKRLQTADLRGRVVLLTGARVKIGFQAALKLLRCGARVLATTRFPVDAAARFAALPDFDRWSANLQIFGLDLRDLEALERFCAFLDATEAHLSDIVNNACQTIRRPAQYYRHLIEKELAPHEAPADHRRCLALHEACFGAAAALAVPATKQLLAPLAAPPQRSQGELSQGEAAALFPAGAHDVNGQQLDLRTTNSWLLRLGQVRTGEVLAINTLAPFILNSRLRALLQRSPVAARQVVNVSAMEGKFYRYKTANHPHTNMAKAALNMMTRTCAEELAANGVYMNSIDTGWINDENPLQRAARTAEKHHFQTPLDEVDAAARILDPILSAANGEPPVYGRFVKDYQPCEW
ncbi:hypothetical protein EMIHUDRAFT_65136 [Emiliania huxleyi CCMP1516]|uniref:Oxidoreductase n=2 Tax=Emiliania huxleyi TaxID=2903 RepID=A0A0D3JFP8_EMIH1|nr:hypothetical protein EMIHUDRAFT_65136 [Emiliania huxleyi CCMP1516]EOD22333.1 hypothetical protein EMIHUDRAFT_65136 [Emiliania huxleyi CCMP1516]|eukprot:XP_005774762.1 hypothetical protein EMIHUDRAFT_65136 [Emiliania huxleyi CCMP1516]